MPEAIGGRFQKMCPTAAKKEKRKRKLESLCGL